MLDCGQVTFSQKTSKHLYASFVDFLVCVLYLLPNALVTQYLIFLRLGRAKKKKKKKETYYVEINEKVCDAIDVMPCDGIRGAKVVNLKLDAYKSLIKLGSQIVSINGEHMKTYTFKNIEKLLNKSKVRIKFEVCSFFFYLFYLIKKKKKKKRKSDNEFC
ncbi:hypothetical protein RFI_21090 [Reticulomyxa filosa]|uniref:PDZ domain-containing protein n=1 Tax=Reticulomyxa filosa TaxID=46433 RepID=X6MQX5_RETFI|nr:hypothetical protein RFI_21090 [Reticulomyxa filosa]|eukprot:ETO16264.1 hypothetical protein RFI_21090 [Reticulomyxa filosa]